MLIYLWRKAEILTGIYILTLRKRSGPSSKVKNKTEAAGMSATCWQNTNSQYFDEDRSQS